MFFRLAKVSLCIIDFFYPSLKESLGGIFHFFFFFYFGVKQQIWVELWDCWLRNWQNECLPMSLLQWRSKWSNLVSGTVSLKSARNLRGVPEVSIFFLVLWNFKIILVIGVVQSPVRLHHCIANTFCHLYRIGHLHHQLLKQELAVLLLLCFDYPAA